MVSGSHTLFYSWSLYWPLLMSPKMHGYILYVVHWVYAQSLNEASRDDVWVPVDNTTVTRWHLPLKGTEARMDKPMMTLLIALVRAILSTPIRSTSTTLSSVLVQPANIDRCPVTVEGAVAKYRGNWVLNRVRRHLCLIIKLFLRSKVIFFLAKNPLCNITGGNHIHSCIGCQANRNKNY